MNLCLNMCISIGKSLVVFRGSCFSLHSFKVKNAKIDFFGEKKYFECIFDRFEVQVVTVWSSRLEKHQTLAFLLMVEFLRIFKITHFLRFLKDF